MKIYRITKRLARLILMVAIPFAALLYGQAEQHAMQLRQVWDASAYTCKNLTIFLFRGADELSRNYLTLEEAMDQKKITLHETGSVGELSADNSDNVNQIIEKYGINSYPTTFLLDTEGFIIAKNLRGKLLEDKLFSLIKE